MDSTKRQEVLGWLEDFEIGAAVKRLSEELFGERIKNLEKQIVLVEEQRKLLQEQIVILNDTLKKHSRNSEAHQI